ncbi:DUF397 domain-containing protein [Streptomyces rhizosphaericus]|uniref:DUF397 domain-containing protein n=1 Tax=Streptomyces rhizosphaericus TaxID=114699 RepID=A0ABN1SH36_9ACTN|nr:DUF397 domain-containing protein [Streptomyces indonesiensis]MBI0374934.1 DUF397 domain-containing protein [Streptomyces albiflaviniger]
MREPCISDRDGGWFKSSYSGAGNTECLEAAFLDGEQTGVRDSKVPGGQVIRIPNDAWARFLLAIQRGQLA